MTKEPTSSCALIIIADGFDEAETVLWLTLLRRAGLPIKSVGLTSGLIGGGHGIWLMPDLAFADLDHFLNTTPINLVILPGGGSGLARLEADPRVHKLLRRVVAQGGQIVAGPEGLQIPRFAGVGCNGGIEPDGPVLARDPARSLEAFVQGVIRRLQQSPRM